MSVCREVLVAALKFTLDITKSLLFIGTTQLSSCSLRLSCLGSGGAVVEKRMFKPVLWGPAAHPPVSVVAASASVLYLGDSNS